MQRGSNTSTTKKIFFYTFGVVFVLVAAEFASFVMLCILSSKTVIYRIQLPADIDDQYKKYLEYRDEELGWPKKDEEKLPQVVDRPCVSIYGDSFSESAGVSNENAWHTLLAERLNCRVVEYGVGAYGTDQAYMRFLMNTNDQSKRVILVLSPENILRNVNQHRSMLYFSPEHYFAFKPRFVIGANGLEQITLPDVPEHKIKHFFSEPSNYLKHEYFLPKGPSGSLTMQKPYVITLIKSLLVHYRFKAIRANKLHYEDFYKEDHDSNGLRVTTGIAEAFYRKAIERERTPLIVIIPNGLDLKLFQKNQ